MPADLAPLTTLGLGGPAGRLVDAETESDLITALRTWPDALLLGGGSNVLVADAGVAGTVVCVRTRGIARAGNRLLVAAGEPWDGAVKTSIKTGLAGLECLSGIPGSAGATPIQNVGAYGQEVSDTVAWVRAYDRERDVTVTLAPSECEFGYRTSRFKRGTRFAVLEVAFDLVPSERSRPIRYAELAAALGVDVGDTVPLAEARAAVLGLRRGKGMVIDPDDPDSRSAGSFFTNPILSAEAFAALAARAGEDAPPAWPQPDGRVKTSAAWLIDRAGIGRGEGAGRVGVSTKHTLALVNRGGATTAELVAFARVLAGRVEAAWGVRLVPEPVFVGHAWPD